MGKLSILLGCGIGYVLGARAGRERYDQIEEQARRVWKDPRVQKRKAEAQDVARQKGAELKDKAGDATSKTRDGGSSNGSAGTTSSDLPLSEPRPPLPSDASAPGSSGGKTGGSA